MERDHAGAREPARIQGKVKKALASEAVTDATTRAYLQETDAR
jgi:hypothetical protein